MHAHLYFLKCLTLSLVSLLLARGVQAEIRFNRDIRPLLSDNCFACHGPDESTREAGLRLDVRKAAVTTHQGTAAIVPGDAGASAIVARMTTTDPDERMPPPGSDKALQPEEIALLKQWIDEGAPYEGHWSYEPPKRTTSLRGTAAIDHFILQRFAEAGAEPLPLAEPHELVRRLHFDLTGLPPTSEDVATFQMAFAIEPSAAVAERAEMLIASSRYGERMAAFWLDLVRYADTIGYHSDNPMPVALYREWVINAFNANQPFDQFTRWQLAGDLLPQPTTEQKIASGYNRLLQTTEEGGAQEKEYRAIYAADRVRNVSNVWLGGTLGCAQCHDHKYDPYTMRDFYAMAAFFADVQERGVGKREGALELPTPAQEQERASLRASVHERESTKKAADESLKTAGSGQRKAAKAAVDAAQKRLDDAKQALAKLEESIPRTLITVALKEPRPTRILHRGNWQDDSGALVGPAVPAFLGKVEATHARPSRLDLANWLIGPDNPTTARAFVNRLWKVFYGAGLSRNVDDLGSQGQWPTHPELLDWLAVEFVESGWDVKHMVRLLVNTQAYARSSRLPAEWRQRDPNNTLLVGQTRFRLDAEMVRDNALAISGLLVETLGGESIKPYQPAGYWQHLNFPRRQWAHDQDANQYRRALYTHWQRSFLHPAMLAFDAPSREECTAERPRSNTPLQALVLLNDPTYVEAARAFAERILAEGGEDITARIAWATRTALSRPASSQEASLLESLYHQQFKRYESDSEARQAFLAVGLKECTATPELAATTAVARALLNLHETITRP